MLVLPFQAVLAVDSATLVPEVFVSADNYLQGDVMMIKVANEPNLISGKFGLNKLYFFRTQKQNEWESFVAIDAKKIPGKYNLLINLSNNKKFTKEINILKRDFPVVSFATSKELEDKGYSPKSILKSIQKTEAPKIDKVLAVINSKVYFNKPFIYPLAEITATEEFGDILSTNGSKVQHLGTDLKAKLGNFVFAVNDGKVVFEQNLPDYGKTIIIDHGLGIYSMYLHLSYFNVSLNNMVKQGQVIALSGSTGYSTGPHLHFSIKMRGASVDPIKFITANSKF